jgi:hypothetical protein
VSASLRVEGVTELRRSLEQTAATVPRALTPRIRRVAEAIAADVRSRYPVRSGALAGGVRVQPVSSLEVAVVSTARHAILYDYGSQGPRYERRSGAHRGVMPRGLAFTEARRVGRGRFLNEAREALESLRIPGFVGSPEVRET